MGLEDSQLMKPGAFHACNSEKQIFFEEVGKSKPTILLNSLFSNLWQENVMETNQFRFT